MLRFFTVRFAQPLRRILRGDQAVATVEMAICLPMLVFLVFVSIDTANSIYMKQVITTAAYEGARAGSAHNGTNAQIQNRAQQVLTARRITGGEVTVSSADVSEVERGEAITVTVSAPFNSYFRGPIAPMTSFNVDSNVSMVKQ